MKASIAIFEVDGNRFIVPGYWYDLDAGPGSPDGSTIIFEAMIFRVTVCRSDKSEWLELEVDEDGKGDLPTVPFLLHSRVLKHSGIDVLLISGPLFDQADPTADTDELPRV